MERDAFLDRIATRLGRARVVSAPSRAEVGVPAFHAVDEDGADGPAKFAAELANIGGRALRARDWAHATELLRVEIEQWNPASIVTWSRSEFVGCGIDWLWAEPRVRAVGDRGMQSEAELRGALFGADMGLTTVEAAVAATGTIVLSAAPTRPRAVSLVPTVHVALVRRSQIVPRMGAPLATYARAPAMPSAVHFVSGPSRTSDIENDLTIGVHGPAALVAIVVEAA